MNDLTRTAIIAFITSLFPVINLTGLYRFTSDDISTIMLLVGNGITVFMLLFKKGQQPAP